VGQSGHGNEKVGKEMIEGTKTYYLPNTDIEVEVTYEVGLWN